MPNIIGAIAIRPLAKGAPMVAQATRYLVGEYPRAATSEEWEVFVRQSADDPLRHVGSITAESADEAHETATKLFGWYASAIWVCPALAVRRYSTHTLDDEAAEATPERGDEPRTADLDPMG